VIDDDGQHDFKAQQVRRQLNQRLSMGPEKIWSIGQEDAGEVGSGQVEKSVTEILSGMEHNTRSRKASHSLRFFKEGLPEEHARRRAPRFDSHQREKASSSNIDLPSTGGSGLQTPPPSTPSLDRTSSADDEAKSSQPTAGKPQDAVESSRSPQEYLPGSATDLPSLHVGPTPKKNEDNASQLRSRPALPTPPASGSTVTTDKQEVETQRESGDSTEVGESAEEAEDSGEEKISSAVFLLHQGLEGGVVHEHTASNRHHEPRSGSRTPARPETLNTWLVKADEPEAETRISDASAEEDKPAQSHAAVPFHPIESTGLADRDPQKDFEAPKLQSRPSFPVPEYEDRVHIHQLVPEQPLEAIELIPYKHQVGGHTTLWRFSKRAVCKQLNNRENEFYERIERYHRDLLPFLPRYVLRINN
jgi:inositol-hexakisphosphate 5-kinase